MRTWFILSLSAHLHATYAFPCLFALIWSTSTHVSNLSIQFDLDLSNRLSFFFCFVSIYWQHHSLNDKIKNTYSQFTIKIRINNMINDTHTHTKRQNNWRKRNWKESFVGCCRWISNALHTLHVTRHRPTHTHTFPISPHITPFSNRPQICTIHHARNEWKSSVGWSTDNSLSCLLLSFLFVFLIFHGVALCFPFVSFWCYWRLKQRISIRLCV